MHVQAEENFVLWRCAANMSPCTGIYALIKITNSFIYICLWLIEVCLKCESKNSIVENFARRVVPSIRARRNQLTSSEKNYRRKIYRYDLPS